MWFLTLVTYCALVIQLMFVTVAIGAGLYYLAELVEEYTSLAKKFIWWMNLLTLILFVSLWLFERFPLLNTICGILAQGVHFVILNSFPFVSFLSPVFITAVGFIIINHYLAFSYFSVVHYGFSEVMAYFTLCLWMVPFALFVSLSANDNVLPMTAEGTDGDVVTNYFSKKGKKYGLLTFFNYAKDSILPQRSKKGF